MTPSRTSLVALCLSTLLSAHAKAFDGIQTFAASHHFHKRVVSNTHPQTTRAEAFVVLPGAETVILARPRTEALINVEFSAETR